MRSTPIVLFAAMTISLQAGTLLGPSSYTQPSNSPFAAEILYGSVVLENFEDGLLNIPGVTASAGAVTGPGGLTDSVDADDGVIDGSGTNGKSFFSLDGAGGIRFTFSGNLPTRAGLVWTDAGAGATVSFQAFDQNGLSLGVFPTHVADNSNSGETAEDRFFGAINNGGISSIFVSNSSGGIEIDHLQFGTAVPEPATSLFLGVGVIALACGRRFMKRL
ncbi:MAG: hypothetical protein JWN25_1165 [Verrucomicrobiales bacterium]|nr:hypothetical protein [Verrucomicrobiales bacterium]